MIMNINNYSYMKYQEIKKLSRQDLLNKLKEEMQIIRKLKFSHTISPIENPLLIKKKRRLIAMIKTCISSTNNINKT